MTSTSLPSIISSIITSTAASITSATGIAQCYAAADHENLVLQSIGLTPELCASDGDFSQGLSALESCISKYNSPAYLCASTRDINSILTLINSGVIYCESIGVSRIRRRQAPATISSISGFSDCFERSVSSIESSLCSVASVEGVSRAQCFTTTTTSGSSSSAISPASSAVATGALATTSPDGSEKSHGLSGGAIAGIVVGAIAGLLIFSLGVGFFTYRRRKQQRASATIVASSPEKAQLHSDDVKPDRKELAGTIPRRKSRIVGGLTELPDNTQRGPGELQGDGSARERGELQANEAVGNEMSSATTENGDGSQTHAPHSSLSGQTR